MSNWAVTGEAFVRRGHLVLCLAGFIDSVFLHFSVSVLQLLCCFIQPVKDVTIMLMPKAFIYWLDSFDNLFHLFQGLLTCILIPWGFIQFFVQLLPQEVLPTCVYEMIMLALASAGTVMCVA